VPLPLGSTFSVWIPPGLTKKEARRKVKKILVEMLTDFHGKGKDSPHLSKVVGDKFEFNTELIKGLGFDSLDYVDFIMNVEREFNITIPDNDLEAFKTPNSTITYVLKKVNKN